MDFTNSIVSLSDEIIKQRPFLSHRLWLLLIAYHGFIGRSVFLLVDGYKKNKNIHWQNDDGTKTILKTVLKPEESSMLMGLTVQPYELTLQLLENKILEEIGKFLSSEELVVDSISLIDKISKINESTKTESTNVN